MAPLLLISLILSSFSSSQDTTMRSLCWAVLGLFSALLASGKYPTHKKEETLNVIISDVVLWRWLIFPKHKSPSAKEMLSTSGEA